MPVGRSKRPSFSQGRSGAGAWRSTQLAGAASGRRRDQRATKPAAPPPARPAPVFASFRAATGSAAELSVMSGKGVCQRRPAGAYEETMRRPARGCSPTARCWPSSAAIRAAGRWLLAATVVLTLAAIACELLVPRAAQALIDAAIAAGPRRRGLAGLGRSSCGVYLGLLGVRNSAMRFWTPWRPRPCRR